MSKETVNFEPKALTFFQKEISMIQDSSLQGLFYNALAIAPKSFHEDEEILNHSKKAFYILKALLEIKDVQGTVRDALLGTVLICKIMYNEFKKEMRHLHTVAVRKYLEDRKVNKDAHQGLWENIIRAIESHTGDNRVSPLLVAKPGTAENEVYTAYILADMDFINLDWEKLKTK